jgi:valyl-tRNA synthetase
MSKTKGNVIDPLIVMEDMGTDALRFTLLVGSTPGKDSNLSLKKVEGNRNFANKIWNAGRFVIGSLAQIPEKPEASPVWTLADSWIWARINGLVRETERLFSNYQYGEAGRQIYEFFWSEFADWYLEIAKTQLAEGGDRAYYTASTLVRVLDASLRMLHPFTPFVTEELWQALKSAALKAGFTPFDSHLTWEKALIIAHWPEAGAPEGWEDQTLQDFGLIQEVVRAIRNLRSEKGVQPSKKISALIAASDKTDLLKKQSSVLCSLANVEPAALKIVAYPSQQPENTVSLVVAGIEVYLPLADLVDPQQEKARLIKELTDTRAQIGRLETLLSSDFGSKAPPQVVEKERGRLAQFKETALKLEQQLSAMDQ